MVTTTLGLTELMKSAYQRATRNAANPNLTIMTRAREAARANALAGELAATCPGCWECEGAGR